MNILFIIFTVICSVFYLLFTLLSKWRHFENDIFKYKYRLNILGIGGSEHLWNVLCMERWYKCTLQLHGSIRRHAIKRPPLVWLLYWSTYTRWAIYVLDEHVVVRMSIMLKRFCGVKLQRTYRNAIII